MAGAWRTISVALVADTAGYNAKMKQASSATSKLGASTSKTAGQAQKSGGLWSKAMGGMKASTVALGTAVGFSAVKIGSKLIDVGVSAFKMGQDIEKSRAVLTGLTGSASTASSMLDKLHKVSSKSSLNYTGYLKAAEALAYAGVTGDRTVRILDHVGKAIVGAGGDTSNLEAASAAMLKMVNVGKVQRRELIQLSNATVPIFDGLAAHFGTTIAGVNKMVAAGQVGLEDVLTVMENGTGKIWAKQEASAASVEKTFKATFARIKGNAMVAVGEAIASTMPKLMEAATAAANVIMGLFASLDGAWQSIQDVGQNLITIFKALWDGIKPVGVLVGSIFGAALVGTLSAAAGALSLITGLMAHFSGVVKVVGEAFAAWKAVQIIGGVLTALGGMVSGFVQAAARIVGAGGDMITRMGGVRGAAGQMAKSFAGGALPVLGIMAVVAAFQGMQKSADDAKKAVKAVNDAAVGKGFEGLRVAYNKSADAAQHFSGSVNEGQSTLGQLGRSFQSAVQLLTPWKNTVSDATDAVKAHAKNAEALAKQIPMVKSEMVRLAHQYGLTTAQVDAYLSSDKNLNLTTASAVDIHKSLAKTLGKVAQILGTTKEKAADMVGAMGLNAKQAKEMAKDMQKLTDKVAGTVLSFGDLSQVKDFKVKAEVKTPPISDILNWYGNVLDETATFSKNISTLMAQGYDPGLITRFMTAGVEKAGPTVQALVDNYTTGTRDYINAAEKMMRKFAEKQARLARITFKSTRGTDQMAADAANAAQILEASYDDNFNPEELAKKLGMNSTDWDRTVKEYQLEGIPKLKSALVRIGDHLEVRIGVGEKPTFQQSLMGIQLSLQEFVTGDYSPRVGLNTVRFAQDAKAVQSKLDALTQYHRELLLDPKASPEAINKVEAQMEVLSRIREAQIKGVPIDNALVDKIYNDVARERDVNMPAKPRNTAGADKDLSYVARFRDAIINAHPRNTTGADKDLTFVSRFRDAIMNAHPRNTRAVGADLDNVAHPRTANMDAHPRNTRGAGVDLDNTAHPRTSHISAATNHNNLQSISNTLANWFPAYRTQTVQIRSIHSPGRRYGGARDGMKHARDGLVATGGRTLYSWGEPATGGEAFIPKNISSLRAKKLLDVAAGWHGLTVGRPAAQLAGGGVGRPAAQLAGGGVDQSVRVIFEDGAIQADGMDAAAAADMIGQRFTYRLAIRGGRR